MFVLGLCVQYIDVFLFFASAALQSTFSISASVIKMLVVAAKTFICNIFAVNLDKINIR